MNIGTRTHHIPHAVVLLAAMDTLRGARQVALVVELTRGGSMPRQREQSKSHNRSRTSGDCCPAAERSVYLESKLQITGRRYSVRIRHELARTSRCRFAITIIDTPTNLYAARLARYPSGPSACCHEAQVALGY
jgi:hypothetical protein